MLYIMQSLCKLLSYSFYMMEVFDGKMNWVSELLSVINFFVISQSWQMAVRIPNVLHYVTILQLVQS